MCCVKLIEIVKFCHQLFKCWFYVKLISRNSFVISNSTSSIFFNFGPLKKMIIMIINIFLCFQRPLIRFFKCLYTFLYLIYCLSWGCKLFMKKLQLRNTFNNFPCAMNPLLQCLDSNCEFHNLRTHYYFIHMSNICRHIVSKKLSHQNPCHLSPYVL